MYIYTCMHKYMRMCINKSPVVDLCSFSLSPESVRALAMRASASAREKKSDICMDGCMHTCVHMCAQEPRRAYTLYICIYIET
jgi:hypothetical protein